MAFTHASPRGARTLFPTLSSFDSAAMVSAFSTRSASFRSVAGDRSPPSTCAFRASM